MVVNGRALELGRQLAAVSFRGHSSRIRAEAREAEEARKRGHEEAGTGK